MGMFYKRIIINNHMSICTVYCSKHFMYVISVSPYEGPLRKYVYTHFVHKGLRHR